MKTNNKGFSLVELIVVIAIMAILAAVAIPTFSGFITKAKVANDESYLNDLKYAVELELAAAGGTPEDLAIAIKITSKKLDATTPIDWVFTGEEGEQAPADPAITLAAVAGVIDTDYIFQGLTDGTYTPDGNGGWSLVPEE